MRIAPFPPLQRHGLEILQVNLGYRCNQSCSHCHVNAGPQRTESMAPETLALIEPVLRARGLRVLDLTGGAPELHGGFRSLVRQARRLGVEVIDRCNLTILQESGQEDLAEFLAAEGVEVVASLPCYEENNVDRQRGRGVFERSLEGLLQLNRLGYGQPGSPLRLHLVYNPQGAVLPPPQADLEEAYRSVLQQRYGIVFHRLYALANMPIQRFAEELRRREQLESYLELLAREHRPENLAGVMCRQLISVDWQGFLYDCDFNQQLGLSLLPLTEHGKHNGGRLHLRDLLDLDPQGHPIRVERHCYGCTAGSGSSCSGSLV
ncbi:MAG: arsenosugar biosynthesis radical SAM (seleno)protein ArsS [Prochlorococcaceae cyanobacterium]